MTQFGSVSCVGANRSLPPFAFCPTQGCLCGGGDWPFLLPGLSKSHCLSCCLCGIVSSDCDADLCEPESPFVSGRYQLIMEGKRNNMKRDWELHFWWLLVSCHMSVMSVLRHIIICLILIYPVLDALLRVVPLLCWISSVCRSETFTTTVCSYSVYGFLGLETQLWDGSVQCNWERYLWAVQRQRLIVLWHCGIVLMCIVIPLRVSSPSVPGVLVHMR